MPIYEYHCESCGFQKEFLQKMSDPVLTTCPACKKESLHKMVTAAGFQLKGSGWYVTDFKNGSSSAKESKSEGSAAHSCGSGACGCS
jgi:putative FmdB family regulatory protein